MTRGFSWKELLAILGGLLLLGALSWGVVALATPVKSVPPPQGWELSVKKLIRGQLETALDAQEVRKPKTQAALKAIVLRLEGALREPLPYSVDVVVVASPQINALTFPGGLIVVDEALLEHASGAEEVAAVLAHEMGHVAHHDSADSLKRGLLLASLASLTAGTDTMREVVQTLSRDAFTRQVEDRADQFAFDLLARAQIKPSRLGDFLASLPQTPQGTFVQKNLPYLLDHPSQELRIAKARRAPFSGDESPLPIDWAAVKSELSSRQ